MKKIPIILFLLLSNAIYPFQAIGQEKKDLLTGRYSRKFLAESLQRDHKWIKYPEYKDKRIDIWDVCEKIPHTPLLRGICLTCFFCVYFKEGTEWQN